MNWSGGLEMAEARDDPFSETQKALLPPIFSIEFIWAFIINSVAIWLFLRQTKGWHTGTVLAFNLALNDLFYIITLPLLVVYYSNNKEWIFGKALCKIERFLFTCNLYGSKFLITCISFNRYLAIVHPMFTRNKIQAKHGKVVSLLVWVLAIILTSPTLYFSTVHVKGNRSECLGSASDEMLPRYFPYSLFLAVFGCALPFAVNVMSYLCIFREVGRSQSVSSTERWQVARLVCVVLLLYAVSFIPYTLLRNLNLYQRLLHINGSDAGARSHSDTTTFYLAYQVSKCMLTLSMCIHPLLYATLFNKLKRLCLCKTQQ
ncbi:P2Y purinoceptor 11 [Mustelus asterias]